MGNIVLIRKPLAKLITERLRRRYNITTDLNMYSSWFICVLLLVLTKTAIFPPKSPILNDLCIESISLSEMQESVLKV